MKRYVWLFLMMLMTGLHVRAQHVATADNISIQHAGDSVYVTFDLLPGSEKLPADSKLTITPVITIGSNTVAMPYVGIYGRTAYLTVIRSGQRVADNEAMTICYKEMEQPLHYVGSAPYAVWMDGAQFKLVTVETDHCGLELGRQELLVAYPEGTLAPPLRYQTKPELTVIEHKPYTVTDSARIEFPKNVVEVRPDWSDNERQLARIEQILRDIASRHAELNDVHLKGFASPEGPLKHNQWLALHRAESLKRYLVERLGVNADSIVTSWTAEDWDGMILYVANSSFSDRQVILEILESQLPQKERLHIISKQYPEAYNLLINDCLPYLRYVDATFRYTVMPPPTILPAAEPAAEPPVTVPGGSAAGVIAPIPPTPYKPWLALKTNLLFDVALAFNFEVEVPLGRQNRWSVMYEQWFPWYVWRHNSNAYEILVCGVEGRYWLGRCRDAVPTLSGGFLGLYGALGKSDIEWKSTGDQMEFGSVGFTAGYSWPLSKHWNLEVSASVGLLFGKRHHYNGRFNDTHLIWAYDTNDTYFGPTKAKVSLVWLLGPKKKKGGAQ